MHDPGSFHSPWHVSAWPDYISRLIRPVNKLAMHPTPVSMTRRQELLAAQDQKRREQRARVLELLRDVKDKRHATL